MWSSAKIAEIRWRCRRGMLELDVLLMPFFEQHFLELSEEDKQIFVSLLSAQDPELYAWLLGYEQCLNKELQGMIQRIQQKLNLPV